jgi:hypothetical protein
MWRICAGYASNASNTYENASYIEFVYMPPNPWAYTSGLPNVTTTGFGGTGGMEGNGYRNGSQIGMPVKFITQDTRVSQASPNINWQPAGLAEYKRTDSFYKSTGISFSGQGYVSLQNRKNGGAPSS